MSIQTDVPIRMSDGTVLRADIYRPADARKRPIATKTPTIVNLTPCTKHFAGHRGHRTPGPQTVHGAGGVQDLHLGPDHCAAPTTRSALMLCDGGAKTMMADYDLIRSGYTRWSSTSAAPASRRASGRPSRAGSRRTPSGHRWAARQKWSDGKIGMSGVSYSGINQICAAKMAPKALKAIFPVEPGGDLIRDVVAGRRTWCRVPAVCG